MMITSTKEFCKKKEGLVEEENQIVQRERIDSSHISYPIHLLSFSYIYPTHALMFHFLGRS
jgi:hypothetical protein